MAEVVGESSVGRMDETDGTMESRKVQRQSLGKDGQENGREVCEDYHEAPRRLLLVAE